MKAPRRLPEDFLYNIPQERAGNRDRIGLPVLNSILDSRIGQMTAITLPTDKERMNLLHEINAIPDSSSKLTSFLDFMISQLDIQSRKYYSTQDELRNLKNRVNNNVFDPSIDERIERLAKILNVQPSKIESKVAELENQRNETIFQYEADYQQCLEALNCPRYGLSNAIEKLLKENDKLHEVTANDRGLISKHSRELLSEEEEPTSSQISASSIKLDSSSSNGGFVTPGKRNQADLVKDILSGLDSA
ncbi:hypothetical protein TVAG_322570 [Trichomonas vaginalis G3]|uniref:Uncharacterized protein n=1 Tax=Trichomonas vaginalis (strain ATCC PRA-98 / G3) TaxID=412133 RepID=A2EL09_TRIV3|nr:hypothetical protein TVAGG3_0234700 [Trichomonas vaginalis G3]EAY06637.1 hypothetical protein TVAG_322570 [Trichomonas vaginalis G3]KAI5552904.1 hypothetical protein TVAGG3_0234700 [Trichomonas vaginalis G3]|eukprot:XP_001318860.1 hypothetical protein [Trichomonas vaginalis G3]